jgi:site-specific DNA-adenine methylase
MSVISFFGGKSSKVFQEFINTRIPKNNIKTYIEPFSGSMATYLDDDSLSFEQVIYNDRNYHQVNLMMCCAKPDEFLLVLNRLKETILHTTETDAQKKWEFYRSIYQKYTRNDFLDKSDFEIPDFKRAAMYAFLITSSFSGVYPRGGGFSGYKRDGNKLKIEVLINKLVKGT